MPFSLGRSLGKRVGFGLSADTFPCVGLTGDRVLDAITTGLLDLFNVESVEE